MRTQFRILDEDGNNVGTVLISTIQGDTSLSLESNYDAASATTHARALEYEMEEFIMLGSLARQHRYTLMVRDEPAIVHSFRFAHGGEIKYVQLSAFEENFNEGMLADFREMVFGLSILPSEFAND